MNSTVLALDQDIVASVSKSYVNAFKTVDGGVVTVFGLTNGPFAVPSGTVDSETFKRLAFTPPVANTLSPSAVARKYQVEVDIWRYLSQAKDKIGEYQTQSMQLGLLTDAVVRINTYAIAFHWLQHARNTIVVEGNIDGDSAWADIPL
jgi:hypothetical protein